MTARRRYMSRLCVENLENRWVPTSVAPGIIPGGTYTSDMEFDQTGTYTIAGNLTVSNGAKLTIGAKADGTLVAGVNVVINDDVTLTVATGATVTVNQPVSFAIKEGTFFNSPTQGITINGTMNAINTTFDFGTANNGSDNSLIQVIDGRLTASGSTFKWDQLRLENNSLLGAGDLVNNSFGSTALFLPIGHVQFLNNNKSFGGVYLNAGTAIGTVNLNPLGSVNPANQFYVFNGAMKITAGATVNVGLSANIVIGDDVTLTVDNNAALNVNTPATFLIREGNFFNSPTQGITINGTMNAINTTFDFGTANNGSDNSLIQVIDGRLTASGSTFKWDQLRLENNSLLGAGDLVNNSFGSTALFLPIGHVQFLNNNKSFGGVYLNAGTAIGTVNLNPLGSVNPANQFYVFNGAMKITAGATVNVGLSANIVIGDDVTLTVDNNAALNVNTPATFLIREGNFFNSPTQGITINGTMNAINTTFDFGTANNGSDNSLIQVIDGRLTASGSTFKWDQLRLENNSLLGAGDLVNNSFGSTALFLPIGHVQFLNNNKSFGGVYLNAGTATGTVTLAPLGSVNPANQFYVFNGAMKISAGTTVNVIPNANIVIGDDVTVTVDSNATLNVNTPTTFLIREGNFFNSPTQGITVNGTMNAANTTFGFGTANNGSDNSLIQISPGAKLNISGGTFGWDNLKIADNASAYIKFLTLNGVMFLDSKASLDITENDFGGVMANGIVAEPVGKPADHINLANNFWGSGANNVSIGNKILDQSDNATRPTIDFLPFYDPRPVGVTAAIINGGVAQRSRVTSLTVTFNRPVTLAPDTFTLARAGATLVSGTPTTGQGKVIVSPSPAPTIFSSLYTLAFDTNTAAVVGNGVENGSLSDGSWVLTVAADGVMDSAGTQPAADYTTPTTGGAGSGWIYRLFGDFNGDATVSASDFIQFRLAFGGTNTLFDFDGDGSVSASDFIQFRLRFGGSI